MAKIRILLTDDHTLFREGIRTLLAAEPDMEVIGEASNASDSVNLAARLHPDLVLMDIGMQGASCFEGTRQIRRFNPEAKVLFLTMYDDEDYVAQCVEAGANGYILKDSPSEELLEAIRQVAQGGSYLSSKVLGHLVADCHSRDKQRVPRFGTLTRREIEILKMLAEGLSVRETAHTLNLSVKTVEAHKFNLMRKLDLHNKAQLVQYAIQKRL